eukprot:TRINITY_DN14538_c0_g1_i6.p1 TRINITY_DN14538_c0_g1~~TRINITY_DN14538_c0_g1_i6.p1  ORF type:complete len:204 (+),score=-10.17 TRINITY_DN14538_c0_g1_i6:66-677(+)
MQAHLRGAGKCNVCFLFYQGFDNYQQFFLLVFHLRQFIRGKIILNQFISLAQFILYNYTIYFDFISLVFVLPIIFVMRGEGFFLNLGLILFLLCTTPVLSCVQIYNFKTAIVRFQALFFELELNQVCTQLQKYRCKWLLLFKSVFEMSCLQFFKSFFSPFLLKNFCNLLKISSWKLSKSRQFFHGVEQKMDIYVSIFFFIFIL